MDRWDRIVTLHAHVEHELTTALQQRHGLGLSDYRALARLAATADGELRMQELAVAVGLDQSSVTRLVARLEQAGLARRDLCPDDRRGVYTVITEGGRERVTAARPHYEQALTKALAEAAADPLLAPMVAALRS